MNQPALRRGLLIRVCLWHRAGPQHRGSIAADLPTMHTQRQRKRCTHAIRMYCTATVYVLFPHIVQTSPFGCKPQEGVRGGGGEILHTAFDSLLFSRVSVLFLFLIFCCFKQCGRVRASTQGSAVLAFEKNCPSSKAGLSALHTCPACMNICSTVHLCYRIYHAKAMAGR